MTKKEVTAKFEEHRKLVTFTIAKYYHQYLSDDDIVQLGNIGLWKAILYHKPDRGAFSTYATACIKREIDTHFMFMNAQKRTADVCSLDGVNTNENKGGSEDTVSMYALIAGDTDVNWFDSEAILKNLSERDRFILAETLKGYTQRDIARVLGCSGELVRLRLNHIRYAVKKELRCNA